MRKEDLFSLAVYAVMIVIALFVGLQVIAPSFTVTGITGTNQYLFALGSIMAGFFINVILLELGHVVGAKVGGYDVLSVNILGFCLYKHDGKFKFGIRSFDGLTGETKITPRKQNASPYPNLWFGLIFFVIEFIAGIVAYSLIPTDLWIRYSIIIATAVGGMLMFYNVMPLKLDTMNDGYRMALISKGVNVEAYNELMRIERLYSEGKEPDGIKTFEEITTLTAQVNLYRVYELLGLDKFEEAEALLDNIIAKPEKLNDVTNGRVFSQKIYIRLLLSSKEEGVEFYKNKMNSRQKKFLASDLSMESLRAYLLVAGTVEDSQSECIYVLERKKGALKRSVEPGRKDVENRLFDKAFDKVKTEHPDWTFTY
jgi:hypothetical protein